MNDEAIRMICDTVDKLPWTCLAAMLIYRFARGVGRHLEEML